MSLISDAIAQTIETFESARSQEILEKREQWNRDYNEFKEREGAIINALRLLGIDQPLDTADIPQGTPIPKLIQVKFYWKVDPDSAAIAVAVEYELGGWLVKSEDFSFASKMDKDTLKIVIARCLAKVYMDRKYKPKPPNLEGFGQEKSNG
jgi:hypothetical protein